MEQIESLLEGIFEKHFNLKDADWSGLAKHTEISDCKKNRSIRLAGKAEINLYFLLTGASGTVIYKNDKLVCIDICFQNEFFGDYQSLISSTKSALEIRALSNCTYLSIPFDKLLLFYETIPEIQVERIRRLSAENLYLLKNQELIELKTLSAKERYRNLLERQPDIIQQIPLKYIASYLGITAESMSRIRKSM